MIIKTWIWKIKVWGYNQGYLATIKYKLETLRLKMGINECVTVSVLTAVNSTTQNSSDNLPSSQQWTLTAWKFSIFNFYSILQKNRHQQKYTQTHTTKLETSFPLSTLYNMQMVPSFILLGRRDDPEETVLEPRWNAAVRTPRSQLAAQYDGTSITHRNTTMRTARCNKTILWCYKLCC